MSLPEEPAGSADTAAPAARGSRFRPLVFGTFAGLAVILLIGLAMVFFSRERLSLLTQAAFDTAVGRWDENGPADYNLDLELLGNRPGKIHVEVRGGQVTHMVRDGVEPKQKRVWDVWSVPGQFDTIEQEMEMAKHPKTSFGRSASQVVMWAEFDPKYGYPRHYKRVVLGADFEVDWTITHFAVLDSSKTPGK